MLKRISFLLLIAFLLCGCGRNFDKEEITFSSWGSITEVQILKQVIADFEKENPKVKVNFMHIPQNYFQKIHLLFASNTAPDVLFMNNLNLPIYESKLEDLTEFVNAENFYPQATAGISYNGKILGIPRDISNLVLYVNLDKMSLPDSDWNLEELLANALKTTNNDVFGIGAEDKIYWALPYLSYFDGGILDERYNLLIDSQESKKALKFYQDLTKEYKVAPTKSQVGSSTLAQMFLDGKIVMYLSGRWMYPKISEKASFNWAVINFPYGKGSQLCDVSGWVISKDSKHKEASIKLVEFLSSEKTSAYFTKTGLIVPARIDTSELLNNSEHNEQVFLDVIKHSQTTPVNKDYKKITDKIDSEMLSYKVQK